MTFAASATRMLAAEVEYCQSSYEAAEGADAVAIVTEWNEFKLLNLERLRGVMRRPLIFDGRNIYDRAYRVLRYRGVGRSHGEAAPRPSGERAVRPSRHRRKRRPYRLLARSPRWARAGRAACRAPLPLATVTPTTRPRRRARRPAASRPRPPTSSVFAGARPPAAATPCGHAGARHAGAAPTRMTAHGRADNRLASGRSAVPADGPRAAAVAAWTTRSTR
jgi:hypothetical protein